MSVVVLSEYRESRGLPVIESSGPEIPSDLARILRHGGSGGGGPRKPRAPRERCGGLAWYPRLGVWKSSNVWLNPETMESRSYDWWLMTRRIGRYLVFNSYRYSSSTTGHQWKVRRWMREQGKDWVAIEAPGGLQDLASARDHYTRKIAELRDEIANPRSRPMKNVDRRRAIAWYEADLALVHELMAVQS